MFFRKNNGLRPLDAFKNSNTAISKTKVTSKTLESLLYPEVVFFFLTSYFHLPFLPFFSLKYSWFTMLLVSGVQLSDSDIYIFLFP